MTSRDLTEEERLDLGAWVGAELRDHWMAGAHALSLTQPWAWAMVELGKPVDNRKRKDGREPKNITRYRGTLLLHAARSFKGWDFVAASDKIHALTGRRPPPKVELERGAIVGECRAIGTVETDGTIWGGSSRRPTWSRDALSLSADEEIAVRQWHFVGSYGLIVRDIRRYEKPVLLVPGRLGIWRPSLEVLEACWHARAR